MTTYAFRGPSGDIVAMYPEFSRPTPVHTLEPSALAAVESVRRLGAEKRLDAEVARIVTKVGRPKVIPYEGDPVTASARRLLALAEAAGFTAQLLTTHDSCTVEGHHPDRVGFRALWVRGASKSATWHEPWRYEIIRDDRPIAVDSRTKTGKAGHRSPGMGRDRLSIAGTPWGIGIGVTELTKRLRELGSAA